MVAVLDVVRLGMFHSDFGPKMGDLLNSIDAQLKASLPPANQTMGLRFIANAFKYDQLRKTVLARAAEILHLCAALDTSMTKSVRIAVSTVLLKYVTLRIISFEVFGIVADCSVSLSIFAASLSPDAQRSLCEVVVHMIGNEDDDEVLARVVTALGTVAALVPALRPSLAASIAALEKTSQRPMSDAALVARQTLPMFK
jgi:hypothetical protein